jgi:hypothetical protein
LLLERNHPRGELIQLGPLAKSGDNEARWRIQRLEVDEDLLLSPRLAARGKQWRYTFDRGFIRVAEFQTYGEQAADAESLSALCGDPHAGLIERIELGVVEYGGPVDEITGLRPLVHSRADVGDLDRELAGLRWLNDVGLYGVACDRLSLRTLRRLQTDSTTCADASIDLPMLEALSWRAYTADVGFGNVLRGHLPALRSVTVEPGSPPMIAALAREPLARQLETLVLNTDDLDALTHLVTHAGAFPRIRQIYVNGIYEQLEQAVVDTLRVALERAYPGAVIGVSWDALMPVPPRPPEARHDQTTVDDQSRRPDGTIDAIGRWQRGN